jgi:hypothetical protein
VALHGYSHLALSAVRQMAEFGASVPADQQRKLLVAGKRFLEDNVGGGVQTFVPPWNMYTSATLDVLAELGVSNVSAAMQVTWTKPQLRFLPCTTFPERMLGAVAQARRLDPADAIVVTNLHDYDFQEAGYGGSWDWLQFEKALKELRSLSGVEHHTIGSLAAAHPDTLSPERLLANVQFQERASRWPAPFQLRRRSGVYWSQAKAHTWATVHSLRLILGV